jgi:hypothetical protein
MSTATSRLVLVALVVALTHHALLVKRKFYFTFFENVIALI